MLDYFLEKLDELSRMMVEVQLQMMSVQSQLESSLFKETGKTAGTVEFLVGPPQELKITVPIFPPKIRVHPELLYAKNKQGPSTYSQVRDLWFATIRNLLFGNKEQLSELKTFHKAIVWFQFFFPDERVRDVDNFSVKLINDALCKCKLLKDDDHRILSVIVTAAVDQNNPRTQIIVLEDLGQLKAIKPKLAYGCM